jgi:hypothetical protein
MVKTVGPFSASVSLYREREGDWYSPTLTASFRVGDLQTGLIPDRVAARLRQRGREEIRMPEPGTRSRPTKRAAAADGAKPASVVEGCV